MHQRSAVYKTLFGLSDDVHFCEIAGTFVFLDARQDQYTRLSADQATWFAEVLRCDRKDCLSEEARTLALRLVTRGLLEHSHDSDLTSLKPYARSHATASALVDRFEAPASPSLRFLASYAWCIAACAGLSRHRSFSDALSAARNWKLRADKTPQSYTLDELLSAFHSLSPYFITTNDACLFRSMLLVRFLSRFGFASEWVFGVRISPFRAHCWVERDHIILNDYLDNTLNYHPLLSV